MKRVALPALLLGAPAFAAQAAFPAGVYELTAQTVMPHLEEALRYATVHERQCVAASDLSVLFPILRHPAFDGCKLGNQNQQGDSIELVLQCRTPQAAAGTARLTLGADRVSAVLELKMGGKNMTLSQRVEGARQGPCERAQ